MVRNNNVTEIIFWFILIWFIGVAVNINLTLGMIYLAFTLGGAIYLKRDKIRTIPLDRTGKWFFPFIQSILIYIGFVFIASILLPIFEKIEVGKLLQLIATTSPAFAESEILNIISYVGYIPIIETLFFIISMDYLATQLRIDITKRGLIKLKTWALIFGLSLVFLFYHITAKGITNNAALLLVFLMMVVTLSFAIFFGEAKQVVFFHIIANAFGIGLLATWIGGVVGFIVLFIILNKYKKIPKF